MMSNNMSDYYPSNNDNYDNNYIYDSGSSRRSTSRRNVKEPLIQDFGSLQDWRSSKIGVGRLGDNKVGDDMVNEVRNNNASRGSRRRNNNMDVPPLLTNGKVKPVTGNKFTATAIFIRA